MTVGLLFVPKILALLDLRRRPDEVAAFGGWLRVLSGVVLETVLFTLLAPILMLFHTKFFVLTLAKQSVAWVAQRRGRTGESGLSEAFLTHWVHTLIGLGWAVFAWRVSPALALWLSPILAAFIFSIPMSYWTGRLAPGLALRRWGIFRTPEESRPLPEISRLSELMDRVHETSPLPELAPDYGLLQAVLDPYVNAVHVALLRTKDEPSPASGEHFSGLRERLLRDGPAALNSRDKLSLLMDVDSMNTLHQELWASPTARLARWWQLAIAHYRILTPTPRTALNR
jgi:membrane glycosyltransferase